MGNDFSHRYPWIKKSWVQNTIILSVGVLAVYALVCWDVVSRAKESYLQAEQYMEWHRHPEKKKVYFENQFEKDKKELENLLKRNKITQDEFRNRLDALEFDREFNIGESSLKYAYQWYKDTYELFSPPVSKWVIQARKKAPHTLELWKDELRQKGVPFEDYMFE